MDSRNLSGFRVCIKLCLEDNKDSRKCFIFINKEWPKIKNVQDHIKTIFNINGNIDIFVGDILLPENETIRIIQLDDILVVKPQKVSKEQARSNYPQLNEVEPNIFPELNRVNKSKVVPNVNNIDSEKFFSECLEDLRYRREQITKGTKLDLNCASNLNEIEEVNMLYPVPVEKKRKRKHKKKTKLNEISFGEDKSSNKSDLISFDSSESYSKHIHFSDEESKELHAHSSPKSRNNNIAEEFRSSLRQLVNKPASEKVFSRKAETSDNLICNNQVAEADFHSDSKNDNICNDKTGVVDSMKFVPKVGDLIAFKKIKLGSDYTPQKSSEIVGEAMTIEESAGSLAVVFVLKEGVEEFENPNGKFSMEVDDNDKLSDKINLAEINWHEVLEPRLLRRI